MIKTDEDALICDLAETYHIFDYRQLPVNMVAVFSYGLKNDSRIKMIMNDQNISLENLLLAGISDKVGLLLWMNSKDGQKNKNRPAPLLELLTGGAKKSDDTVVFNSGEEFERKRQELIGGG
jgi:hypothetical protein